MARLNVVLLIGYLTADPELKQTAQGTSVCTFSVAVNRRQVKEGAPTCDFIDVVAWRQTAEFVAKYFSKGKPLLVRGELRVRSYTDKNGNKRYATEVVADEVGFVDHKTVGMQAAAPTVGSGGYNPYNVATAEQFEEVSDEALPF